MKFSAKLAYAIITAMSVFAAPLIQAMENAGPPPSIAERVKALDQQLFTGKDAIKIEPQDQAVMANSAEALAAKLPTPGLRVGAKAPNFSLKNAYGKKVRLSHLLRKGPVILAFYRGAWCPYCSIELHALNESLPNFKKFGATLVAITPQTPDKSLAQVNKDGYPFEILSDLDDKVIKAYKLYWEVSPELDAAFKHSFGLDVTAYNGKGRRGLPVPGTFVIDRSGTVRAAFADVDYKKRMEPVAILAALQDIKDQDSRR
jgi:peroxiredoxin